MPAAPHISIAALNQKMQAAVARNDDRAVMAIVHEGLSAHPDWKEGWWELGSVLYEHDDYAGSRDAFVHLADLDPKAGAPLIMLGLCDFELRDYGLALQHLEKGRALGFPANPELSAAARYHEALVLLQMGEFERAQLILNGFAHDSQHSDDIVVAFGLAALHIPLVVAQAADVLGKDRLEVIRQVGEAEYLAGQHKPKESKAILDQLLAAHPQLPFLHYAAGLLASAVGDNTAAKDLFRQELGLNPKNVIARLQLASIALNEGRYAEGIPPAREALQLQPRFFAAHYILGNLLIFSGKLQEGVRELEISRNLNPGSSEVRYSLAQGYLRLHRRADARREQQAFAQLKPVEDSILHQGTLPASLFTSGTDTAK